MPRNPIVPCSLCGKLTYPGKGSRPPAERVCHACRRALRERGEPAPGSTVPICVVCGERIQPRRSDGRRVNRRATCSTACQSVRMGKNAERPCASGCGTLVRGGLRKLCPACLAVATRDKNRRKNVRRRGVHSSVRQVRILAIAERDGWRCHLCRKKVDPKLRNPHRMSATLDHLIPVADGGSDEPENLSLAHLSCNSSRGTGGIVQLLLIG